MNLKQSRAHQLEGSAALAALSIASSALAFHQPAAAFPLIPKDFSLKVVGFGLTVAEPNRNSLEAT